MLDSLLGCNAANFVCYWARGPLSLISHECHFATRRGSMQTPRPACRDFLKRSALHPLTPGVAKCGAMRYFRDMRHATIPEAVAEKATAVRATVAHSLSEELKAQRWSQRAAATALGLTPRYINSRANGDVDLSASDLAMFAEFLNIPITRFFDEHRDPDSNVVSIGAKKSPNHRSLVPMVAGSNPVGGTKDHLAPVTHIRFGA